MDEERAKPQRNNQDGNKVINQQQQQHEPQKCPRCDSVNTKFCYYNNYSLSQPRYFCKACRRYWTQGGTLRNVPVGGASRKGKRAKTMPSSSSATTSSRSVLQPQQQDHQLHERYLTSMPFTQNLGHLGGSTGLGGASNLGLLHGLNAISSCGQRQMQSQLFENMEPLPAHRGLLLQPAMTSGYMTDWPRSFINKSHASSSAAAASTGHGALWSTTTGNNASVTAGPSLNSSQLLPDDHAASFDAAGLPH